MVSNFRILTLILLRPSTYSFFKTFFSSFVSQSGKSQWRSYDVIVVQNILDEFKKDSQNYFGIVNSLFVLNKVDDIYLKSNQEEISELVKSANSILNQTNKQDYLVPIQNRLEKL